MSFEQILACAMGMAYLCVTQNTTKVATVVSEDAAVASVFSELESIHSLREKQITLTAFLNGKRCFVPLPTGFGKSLIYRAAPLLILFVDRIG